MKKDITFSFGKNWKNFLNRMTDDRTREAEQSLTDFLKTNDLQGKNFLDIGCAVSTWTRFPLNAVDICIKKQTVRKTGKF